MPFAAMVRVAALLKCFNDFEISMLQILTIGLVVLVFAVLIVAGLALRKPHAFSIARSIDVAAPALSIFPLIEDFHRWREWSPYEGRDPKMTRSYEGMPRGMGAVYEWAGSSDVGTGRMEIVDTTAPSRIVIQLDFSKPFEALNMAEFTLVSAGEVTTVRWAMRGPAPFISRLMQVFMNFDKMVGKDFEAGLERLKAIAERT